MNLYDYGMDPLDWEFCFWSVEEYKAHIAGRFQLKEAFYAACGIELSEVLQQIDDLQQAAEEDMVKMFGKMPELRCPPMIFPIPKGGATNGAAFGIVMKLDDDGDTFVYSPVPLDFLR